MLSYFVTNRIAVFVIFNLSLFILTYALLFAYNLWNVKQFTSKLQLLKLTGFVLLKCVFSNVRLKKKKKTTACLSSTAKISSASWSCITLSTEREDISLQCSNFVHACEFVSWTCCVFYCRCLWTPTRNGAKLTCKRASDEAQQLKRETWKWKQNTFRQIYHSKPTTQNPWYKHSVHESVHNLTFILFFR